jgi:hypothetical protein
VQRLPPRDHSSCDAVLTLASACARQPAPWKNPRSSEDVVNRPALFGAQCGPTLSASSTIPPVESIATVLDVNQTLSSPPLSVSLGSHSTGEWTGDADHISSSTSHCATLAFKPLEAPLVTLLNLAASATSFVPLTKWEDLRPRTRPPVTSRDGQLSTRCKCFLGCPRMHLDAPREEVGTEEDQGTSPDQQCPPSAIAPKESVAS